jgi:hypothetical protein
MIAIRLRWWLQAPSPERDRQWKMMRHGHVVEVRQAENGRDRSSRRYDAVTWAASHEQAGGVESHGSRQNQTQNQCESLVSLQQALRGLTACQAAQLLRHAFMQSSKEIRRSKSSSTSSRPEMHRAIVRRFTASLFDAAGAQRSAPPQHRHSSHSSHSSHT